MISGGVCAVLDYDVEQMTEYVACMAQQIVLPTSPVSPAFRKFVSGLLTATRLPSTTILLGLNYTTRRMNMLNARISGPGKVTDGQVWRMVTIGLLLGSKFLDDNTFQNRSWSEVSGIAVAELNALEQEWLRALDWKVYVNLDTSKDFQAWLQHWESYCEGLAVERSLGRLPPLHPSDMNFQRGQSFAQPYNGYNKSASRERPLSGYHYDRAPWSATSYPTPQTTPPSAPNSGVTTPEYNSATGYDTRWPSAYPRYQHQQAAPYCPTHIASYHTPFTNYGQHYGSAIWDHHALPECNCSFCHQSVKQPYLMAHSYGHQIMA